MEIETNRLYFDRNHSRFNEFSKLFNKGVNHDIKLGKDGNTIMFVLIVGVGRDRMTKSISLENPFVGGTIRGTFFRFESIGLVSGKDKVNSPTVPYYLRFDDNYAITLVSIVENGIQEVESYTFKRHPL